jgi:hypothetical protein
MHPPPLCRPRKGADFARIFLFFFSIFISLTISTLLLLAYSLPFASLEFFFIFFRVYTLQYIAMLQASVHHAHRIAFARFFIFLFSLTLDSVIRCPLSHYS